MKAENIQSNTSASYIAGQRFGTFYNDTALTIVNRLLDDAKSVHTADDVKEYCKGYKSSLVSDSQGSKDSMTSYVRKIMLVATANDAKLNEFHKVKTPAQGAKVIKDKMTKGAKGLDSLAKALRLPTVGKADSAGDSEGDTGTNETQGALDAWWAACEKLGHSDKFGLTTDEMLAHIAQVIAK